MTALSAKRPDQRRVTINDVSQALGLTKSTVSRALNGYPDIAAATQKRVRRMADRMGYRPLSHAQAIRTGRTRSLGLVIQTADHDAQRPFLAEFLAGISETAAHQGWTLTVTAADTEAATLDTMRSLIHDRKADGFILPRTLARDPRIALLRDLDVPFVLFGRTRISDDCAWYDIRGEQAMRDAVAHLVALGHRRIGFVGGGAGYNYANLRLQGYRDGLRDAGLGFDVALVQDNAVTGRAGSAATARLLDLADPPTAIVFAVDTAAIGAWQEAGERGLTIGRDLSVTGYDGLPEGAGVQPQLATFVVDIRRAGTRLADLLIHRIRGTPVSDLREEEDAQFRPGGSIGPAPVNS